MRVLVVDIGGTHVKLAVAGTRLAARFDSGPTLTPQRCLAGIREATRDWRFDVVSIGYPGPVVRGRPAREPHNLAPGWRRVDFTRALGRPVTVVNDAAMQALGSYRGGRLLFLGLGTGLGSAIVDDGRLEPLELAHLPYDEGRTYEEYLGAAGLARIGRHKWERRVHEVVALFRAALVCDHVVLGGGNVKHLRTLPPGTRRGANVMAIRGGARLWASPSDRRPR